MTHVLHTGNLYIDQYVSIERFPNIEQNVNGSQLGKYLGAGFNSMKALVKQGVEVSATSPIGTDANAKLAQAIADRYGVHTLTHIEGNQGWDLVLLLPNGEKTFITLPGVEQKVFTSDITNNLKPLDTYDGLFLSGYSLLDPASLRVIDWILSQWPSNKLTFLDLSPHISEFNDYIKTLINYIINQNTITSGNQVESEVFRDFYGINPTVTRLGEKGCIYQGKLIIGRPVKATDTTGAGDAFNGTFFGQILQGTDPIQACKLANAYAGKTVQQLGPN
ncbi:MAG: PfkB family carbohydrate kinase [Bifidobacteriaceae bacterium]|jgi:sugar/nucleoside kinase (ribokinase family)|nr:PfkB family carbohydrate kinase [Bifidobacteriaceae bacterium]